MICVETNYSVLLLYVEKIILKQEPAKLQKKSTQPTLDNYFPKASESEGAFADYQNKFIQQFDAENSCNNSQEISSSSLVDADWKLNLTQDQTNKTENLKNDEHSKTEMKNSMKNDNVNANQADSQQKSDYSKISSNQQENKASQLKNESELGTNLSSNRNNHNRRIEIQGEPEYFKEKKWRKITLQESCIMYDSNDNPQPSTCFSYYYVPWIDKEDPDKLHKRALDEIARQKGLEAQHSSDDELQEPHTSSAFSAPASLPSEQAPLARSADSAKNDWVPSPQDNFITSLTSGEGRSSSAMDPYGSIGSDTVGNNASSSYSKQGYALGTTISEEAFAGRINVLVNGMGFDKVKAQIALRRAGGDLEDAVFWLTSGMDDEDTTVTLREHESSQSEKSVMNMYDHNVHEVEEVNEVTYSEKYVHLSSSKNGSHSTSSDDVDDDDDVPLLEHVPSNKSAGSVSKDDRWKAITFDPALDLPKQQASLQDARSDSNSGKSAKQEEETRKQDGAKASYDKSVSTKQLEYSDILDEDDDDYDDETWDGEVSGDKDRPFHRKISGAKNNSSLKTDKSAFSSESTRTGSYSDKDRSDEDVIGSLPSEMRRDNRPWRRHGYSEAPEVGLGKDSFNVSFPADPPIETPFDVAKGNGDSKKNYEREKIVENYYMNGFSIGLTAEDLQNCSTIKLMTNCSDEKAKYAYCFFARDTNSAIEYILDEL
ncbi:uncharacterized protein MONOS_9082 [Monocercomonoides exilis]|uniref:uncharacterized protein n=1 Tax=Monocercomonoides exilis TaxID=2049356 RepID=UPI003559D4E5|nr:hypothetical protein MONOS_9082 [Monocercomonoides exilis]|eukprot:MONOS_9082.1-p1 / transcript=MONOS_9082.1 / gene=MONOS_9082 / organism=Monocercomonoides_exilis_PA203 / gene_product=unspecified product / transcript_product=unspecified product / location=Mono_scaffold00363:41983-44657(-) / protein_length=713 / sequence_SO=supercontig / SO=protein_coding / is_pseudo=false